MGAVVAVLEVVVTAGDPVAAAMGFLGPAFPSRVAAAGIKDKLTGVDLSGAISLHFEGKGIASLTYNVQVSTKLRVINVHAWQSIEVGTLTRF